MPVISTLDTLDKDSLVRILIEPRNALVKQYEKLFEMDQVGLEFKEGSLQAIADEAIKRNTGARGLRAILEEVLLDIMFELPSRDDVLRCIITRESITKREKPILVTRDKYKKKEVTA